MSKIVILSVDDEPDMQLLLSQMFRFEIRSEEMEFIFATNGVDAIQLLTDHPHIRIVLADINMPLMNGLEMLDRIEKLNNPLVKVIMISAYGDLQNIRTAMNKGAFDFLIKPIDFSDLKLTIKKTISEIAFLERKQNQSKRLKSLELELLAGATIQNSLLPDINLNINDLKWVSGFDYYQPAKSVGGDFYDVFKLDDHRVAFFIADVSGKGIPAAAYMLICHTAMKIYSKVYDTPSEILFHVNNHLVSDNEESMFVTAFLAIANNEKQQILFANAGHLKPLIINSGQTYWLESNQNVVLGLVENFRFQSGIMEMNQVEKMILFTDGVVEAVNNQGEFYGNGRLLRRTEKSSNEEISEIISLIVNDLNAFSIGLEPFDDITLLAMDFKKC